MLHTSTRSSAASTAAPATRSEAVRVCGFMRVSGSTCRSPLAGELAATRGSCSAVRARANWASAAGRSGHSKWPAPVSWRAQPGWLM